MNTGSSSYQWIIKILILVITCVIYLQTVWHGYGFDDQLTTQLHPTVGKGISGISEILSSNYLSIDGKNAEYRPVAQITFAIEQTLFGSVPQIGHLINLLIYLIIGILIYQVLKSLLSQRATSIALLSVLFFMAHPVHTEVVASLKNREELLALFFGLLSWISLLKYSKNHGLRWAMTGSIFFSLGLMSKISMAPLAAIIPYSILFFNGGKKEPIKVGAILTCVIILYLSLMYTLLPWEDRVYLYFEKPIAFESDPWTRWANILLGIGYYFKLILWPFPLSIYYGYEAIPHVTWSSAWTWIAAFILLFTAYLAAFFNYKRSVLGFGLAFFLIALVPVSNVFYPNAGIVLDRGLFLPSLGFSVVVGYSIYLLSVRYSEWLAVVLSLCLVVTHGVLSFNRVSQWESQEVLFQTDVKNFPNSAKLHQLNGEHYLGQSINAEGSEGVAFLKKAVFHFERSLEIDDSWSALHKKLALVYVQDLDMPELAIPHFTRELALKPRNFTASFNLAKCYYQLDRPDSSIHFIKQTLTINPDHWPSLRQLSIHYLSQHDSLSATYYLNRMIQLDPGSDVPFLILADGYLNKNDTLSAIANFQKAAVINPQNDNTLKFLFNYFYSIGDKEKAESYRDTATTN